MLPQNCRLSLNLNISKYAKSCQCCFHKTVIEARHMLIIYSHMLICICMKFLALSAIHFINETFCDIGNTKSGNCIDEKEEIIGKKDITLNSMHAQN